MLAFIIAVCLITLIIVLVKTKKKIDLGPSNGGGSTQEDSKDPKRPN